MKTTTDELRLKLYQAACNYAEHIFSDRIDYYEAMAVADALEDAAENWAVHARDLSL